MESEQFIYRKGAQQIREIDSYDDRCEGSRFCASPFVAGLSGIALQGSSSLQGSLGGGCLDGRQSDKAHSTFGVSSSAD
jgi:hypothetical protein